MSPGYQRPEGGWRFPFEGMNTKESPDSLSPAKSPLAVNIRRSGADGQIVETRPGSNRLFTTDPGYADVTDLGTYARLATDNNPRILARLGDNTVFLDDGNQVGTLSGTSPGVFMIPYRPNRSPQTWMYIAAEADYQKFSAPDSGDNVTTYPVGIQEQGTPPGVALDVFNFYEFTGSASDWTEGGNAGTPSDVARLSANIGVVVADPDAGSNTRFSAEVDTPSDFQSGMRLTIDSGGTPIDCIVEDVLPSVNQGSDVVIEDIFYFSGGATGQCVIIPRQVPTGPSVPSFAGTTPVAGSIGQDAALAHLRRGSLVDINGGNIFFVEAVVRGRDGRIAFEINAGANTFAAGQTIQGIPAISINQIGSGNAGDTIDADAISTAVSDEGTSTLARALGTNPFDQLLAPSSNTPQLADYLLLGVNVSDLSALTRMTITFNIDSTVDYVTNAFYVELTPQDLVFLPGAVTPAQQDEAVQGVASEPVLLGWNVDGEFYPVSSFVGDLPIVGATLLNVGGGDIAVKTEDLVPVYSDPSAQIDMGSTQPDSNTPLPSNQWATVIIPVSRLVRLGSDKTRTLADCNGVQISVVTTAAITLQLSSFCVGGGQQPDVGQLGTPYFYVARGRSSETGAVGNPSPITRYGVSPRRQGVYVTVNDSNSDTQMDTWDIFRYGGSVTSWRFIGSMPNTGGADTFYDDFADATARAGRAVEYDNLQPWPTIDEPFIVEAGTVSGVTAEIWARGDAIIVVWHSGSSFTNPAPATITRWLPGTLIDLGGRNTYTLYSRPTALTLSSPPDTFHFAYLFRIVENAGPGEPGELVIQEPNVANQDLPYVWGPDANGTIFGSGDPFRPGNVYYSKAFNPDSTPSSYNQEVTSPSEPQLGGVILNGLSFCASSNRWWAMYPQPGTATRYQIVEKPVGRGLAAPYGLCTDGGSNIFFWGKDGIYRSQGGARAESLTNEDLANIFPQEGNEGADYSYNGTTVAAPDYTKASTFRLAWANHFLYADYQDSSGNYHTLTCDLRGGAVAWSVDDYSANAAVTVHKGVAQPSGTLEDSSALYPRILMGNVDGEVLEPETDANDYQSPIAAKYATFEYNGGDIRSNQLWGDAFLDSIPRAELTVTPVTNGAALVGGTTVAAGSTRTQSQVNVNVESKHLGLVASWSDNYDSIDNPTRLFSWQPLNQAVPIQVRTWKSQGLTFGMLGYKHIRQIVFAYKSTADVTLTITVPSDDGIAPAVITLPDSSGALVKTQFNLTYNKSMIFFFTATSTADWQPYLSECEIYVGQWGREEPYSIFRDLEAPIGIGRSVA